MIRLLRASMIVLSVGFLAGFTECYAPVTETGLPRDIKRIAVPIFQFESKGLRYRVENRFTDAVSMEILRKARGIKVQGDLNGADAVIEGSIRDFSFSGVLLDRDGRARVYEVTIVCSVTVRDLRTNRILYDNQNFVLRDNFEFTDDPRSFFNEEDPAVDRIARSFAESLVSTLVNGFGIRDERKKGN